jgi:carboxylesterase
VLPNEFRWWDPVLQAEALPAHGYPRYATRALAQLLRLGDALRTAASQNPPAAARVLVVTNASDERVNNALTAGVAAQWQRQGGRVETYEFPAALGLPHDLIEPIPPHPLTLDVYAQLISLVEGS